MSEAPARRTAEARVELGTALAFVVGFSALFMVCFGGASVLSGYVPWRVRVGFAFEQQIPYWPAWSAVYLSLIALLLLLPVRFRRWRELFPVLAVLSAETIVASVLFIVLPVQSSFAPRHAEGFWGVVFDLADALNLERNLFPSLHVAFAVTALLALWPGLRASLRAGLVAWVLAIVASTMLIHEHHVVDVVAGALLAVALWRRVGAWAKRESVLAAVDVELICLRNAWRFARRHRRYALIELLLLVDSLPHARRRRVLRTGFAFLQTIDDLLDGDRATPGEPLDVVDSIALAITTRRFGDDELMRLARAFVADLETAAGASAVVQAEALIEVMRRDRQRVLAGLPWRSEQLRAHHRATFGLSLDLLLAARGDAVRSADAPELLDALGWCSTARDLRDDLAAGLINIPLDVMQAAGWQAGSRLDVDALLQHDAVRRWLCSEHRQALAALARVDARLALLGRQRGAGVLRLFARSVRTFAGRRFQRLYPPPAEAVGDMAIR